VSDQQAKIYIGPSGWSYPDWEGIVYPAAGPRRIDQLNYISQFFNAVEVNSTFYRPQPPRTTSSWVRRVRRPFSFVFKLHQRFTHDRAEPPSKAEVAQFADGLLPVQQAEMLGCVLLQFPWSFRCNPSAFEWLGHMAEAFERFPLAIEVRHSSWDQPEMRDRLAELRLNYCNIDQPQLRHCIGPGAHATGSIGYVRLHGRRNDTWFADNIQPHERYDYLYKAGELTEWVGRIKKLAGQTDQVFVFSNNHYRGQGPANALQLRAMLEGGKLDVPPDMLQHFDFLRQIAQQPYERPGQQKGLFD
jgi:uncharacterized protein YecE (DUF72 family)